MINKKNLQNETDYLSLDPLPDYENYPRDYEPFIMNIPNTKINEMDIRSQIDKPGHGERGFHDTANDYSFLESLVHKKSLFPSISVVVLTYNRAKTLEKTLCGILRQRYPIDKLQVVVTDDGSSDNTREVVNLFKDRLDISYCFQKDLGFRAARARNNGIRQAKYDFVVLLDVDMFPSASLIYEYSLYSSVIRYGVLIGPRKYTDLRSFSCDQIMSNSFNESVFPEILSENTFSVDIQNGKSQDWRIKFFQTTEYLKKSESPYRYFASGNVAFSKRQFTLIDGFNEDFTTYGCEDMELAYRFFGRGMFLIPAMRAYAYHQEPENGVNEINRSDSCGQSRNRLLDLCPLERKIEHSSTNIFRNKSAAVNPLYSVIYENGGQLSIDVASIDSALQQSNRDGEIVISNLKSIEESDNLEKYFPHHPRVRFLRSDSLSSLDRLKEALSNIRGDFIIIPPYDRLLAVDLCDFLLSKMSEDKNHSFSAMCCTPSFNSLKTDGEKFEGAVFIFRKYRLIRFVSFLTGSRKTHTDSLESMLAEIKNIRFFELKATSTICKNK